MKEWVELKYHISVLTTFLLDMYPILSK